MCDSCQLYSNTRLKSVHLTTGMLKEQLSLQAHELKNYRDKVLKLQDQLIQVGDVNTWLGECLWRH